MIDEESRNEKWKCANVRSVKTFCQHLLIIWSFDFYKEQWGQVQLHRKSLENDVNPDPQT